LRRISSSGQADFTDGVRCVAAVHSFEVCSLGHELSPDDIALPASVQASTNGVFQGSDQADGHGVMLGQYILMASQAYRS